MNKKIEISYKHFSNRNETSNSVQNLFKRAFEAREVAYAPYSHFRVGAALLLDNGEVVIGNNQENASYPVGICAERVALTASGSQFPDTKIEAIAIVAGKDLHNDYATAPCGLCRQSLLEYEVKQNQPIEIYFMGTIGAVIKFDSAKDLLPFCFDGKDLV